MIFRARLITIQCSARQQATNSSRSSGSAGTSTCAKTRCSVDINPQGCNAPYLDVKCDVSGTYKRTLHPVYT